MSKIKEILFDQILTVYSNFEREFKDGDCHWIRSQNFPCKGIKVSVSETSIEIDFTHFETVDFITIKLFLSERIEFPETALYTYERKTSFTIFFRKKKKYSETAALEYAMWQYNIFKMLHECLRKLCSYSRSK